MFRYVLPVLAALVLVTASLIPDDEAAKLPLRPFPPAMAPRVLLIGSSTGGPQAVNKVVAGLKTSRCFGDARSGGARRFRRALSTPRSAPSRSPAARPGRTRRGGRGVGGGPAAGCSARNRAHASQQARPHVHL